MTDDADDTVFDDWLNSVDATAPDELRTTIRRMATTDHQSVVPVDPVRHRHWRLAVAVAATIAVGVAGLAVLLDRRTTPSTLDTVTSPSTQPPPTPTTSATTTPATTAPATTVESAPVPPATPNTVEETASTVVDLPSNPVLVDLGLDDGEVLSGEEALAAMRTLDDDRVGLLRESQGFRATATRRSTWVLTDGSEPRPDEPPTVVDITVLANGDLWAEYENGDWFRFDAAAGTGRSLSTFDDGSQFPLEMNRPAFQHTYSSVLWHDPLQMLGELVEYYPDADNIAIAATTFEGDHAVEVRFEGHRSGSDRFVVDLRSGLIVEHGSTQPDANGTLGSYSTLSELTDADVLPVSTVPQLPDGLEWQRLDGPVDVFPVTLDDAAAAFGSGLVLPQVVADAETLAMEHSATTRDGLVVDSDDPDGELRFVGISHLETVGLLRTTFHTQTERLGRAGTLPEGYVEIGDRVCPAPRGCSWEPLGLGGTKLGAGAFAGEWFRMGARDVGATVDGVSVSIQAPTLDEAIALAETLVVVADIE